MIPQTIASNLEDSLQGAISLKVAEATATLENLKKQMLRSKDIDWARETMKEERSSSSREGGADVASYRVVPTCMR